MTLSQIKIIKLIPALDKKSRECDETIIDDINKTFLTIDEDSKSAYKREIKSIINSSDLKIQDFFLKTIDKISNSIITDNEKITFKYSFLLIKVFNSNESPEIATEIYKNIDKLVFADDIVEFNFYELLIKVALLKQDDDLVKQILEKIQNL